MAISIEALKPAAALKFWSGKVPVTKKEFNTLCANAKARAFTVTGMAKQDQVKAVLQALQKMLDEGGTLADFKDQISDIIETQGWKGKKAYRVENIFRTNMQSAYSAGRYEQLQKSKRLRPYWRYLAVGDRHSRPSHMALNGKIYPADHPFWDLYYPLNGFGCRCIVQSLSKRQVEAGGYTVESEMPGPTMVKMPDGSEVNTNPMPDKGWSNNVGKNWLAGLNS
ncbi:phage minor head protein [Desulfovibrio sp. UCD-KL4C]|uniref:phage head morphogenesis protein n=1 Tax=Desulfovibrio sp. UCD-KL4C TaxID=2578120 RepID=UPI0025C525F6|nr:phage minor head protein [Desulfovibrio sp. UCD-KL4C]